MLLYHGTDSESAKNIIEKGIDLFKCDPFTFSYRRHNLDSKYDVVIDIPADVQISLKTMQIETQLKLFYSFFHTDSFEEYKKDILNRIELISVGDAITQSKQYSFHTPRALNYLKYTRTINVKDLYNVKEG